MAVAFRHTAVPILRPRLDARPRVFGRGSFLGPRPTSHLGAAGNLRHLHRGDTVVGEQRRFYRTEPEWVATCERLKLLPCPHCKAVGTLIRHGSLFGFDDGNPQRKSLRARRIFCSNRRRRPGCGRTFSVWLAETIRRSSLSTRTLLAFLTRLVSDGLAAAIRAVKCHLSNRTLQRFGKRFDHAQSRIRTALLGRGPPPEGWHSKTRADPLPPKFSLTSTPPFRPPTAPLPPIRWRRDPASCERLLTHPCHRIRNALSHGRPR